MTPRPHNSLADESFGHAESHAAAGRHKEMWDHLNQAQIHATNHAKELAESGQHQAALAYRKIALGRVHHISSRIKKSADDFRMSKYSALNALWSVMKRQEPGWHRLKYAIPQVELAKTSKEIDDLLAEYGIKLNRVDNEG